jgi:hypothetical protein
MCGQDAELLNVKEAGSYKLLLCFRETMAFLVKTLLNNKGKM